MYDDREQFMPWYPYHFSNIGPTWADTYDPLRCDFFYWEEDWRHRILINRFYRFEPSRPDIRLLCGVAWDLTALLRPPCSVLVITHLCAHWQVTFLEITLYDVTYGESVVSCYCATMSMRLTTHEIKWKLPYPKYTPMTSTGGVSTLSRTYRNL